MTLLQTAAGKREDTVKPNSFSKEIQALATTGGSAGRKSS